MQTVDLDPGLGGSESEQRIDEKRLANAQFQSPATFAMRSETIHNPWPTRLAFSPTGDPVQSRY
jgi:hypothetical protein